LTSAGGRGRAGARNRQRGVPGVPGDPDGLGLFGSAGLTDDDNTDERETWLLGDEEWDDSSPEGASIGRPGS